MISRRDFGRSAAAALPLGALRGAAMIDSKVDGVQLGAQSYSFRDRSVDQAIAAYKEIGLGESKYLWVNLDIGHFVSAGFDPVSYIQQHHARIATLHIKDRTKGHANLPFGQGETPIKEVLQLLKENRWPIPANIEYEYKGQDTVAEVRKCFQYMKDALR